MARGSGDGFIIAGDGKRRWGLFGAAGVLVRHVDGDDHWYFLARRSSHTHLGGSWAIPGGAIDDDETPLDGALREFGEEIGMDVADHIVAGIHESDHGGWSYWTVIVDVPERFPLPTTLNWETADVCWVRREEVRELDLLSPFAATLEKLGLD